MPVRVESGEVRVVRVSLPKGRVNINAQPWARAFIGGALIGETPLANVELPIGSHTVVLRHPEYPERTETVVVRADGVARLAVNMEAAAP
jgi:serine/threonine-protein kinase